MLEMDNGVWYFALGRFIDQVKIFIEKAEGFEYEFQPIGGFPDLQPGPDGLLSFETIDSEGGHLPGQGYMVQWYPATGKTKKKRRLPPPRPPGAGRGGACRFWRGTP